VKLSVKDSGIGMRSEVQKHIFEPFYTTKDFGQGTGLGLATVYGLVQQHNGFLQFSSKPGEGTLFEIYLPAVSAEENHLEKSESEKEIKGGFETILIADDEPAILKSAKEILENYNYKVFTSQDGQEALEIFKENIKDISLVVSDIIMPEMGGVELKLQIEGLKPDIKFIFMSGYSEKVPPELITLQKPFSTEKLLRTIREILDS
jgi:CheY-like chemotaxis protein